MDNSLQQESSREASQEILKTRIEISVPPRVLLVEDSVSMQLLIEAIFQSLDIPLTLVEHSRVAVELLEEQEFDLVFMDLQMPEMGGVEAPKRIGTHVGPEALPIIILSATVQDHEIQEGLAAGANAYLAKPIDMEALLAALLQYWRPSAAADQ
jgi:CheY-like chemotaxis protein